MLGLRFYPVILIEAKNLLLAFASCLSFRSAAEESAVAFAIASEVGAGWQVGALAHTLPHIKHRHGTGL